MQECSAGAVQEMEAARREKAAMRIQGAWKAFRGRKAAATVIQKHLRGFLARHAYAEQKALAALLQVLCPIICPYPSDAGSTHVASTNLHIVEGLCTCLVMLVEALVHLFGCRRVVCTDLVHHHRSRAGGQLLGLWWPALR
jgi:hypothetical protein